MSMPSYGASGFQGKVCKQSAGPVQHFALKVDNLEETILELKNKGIEIKENIEFITYEGGTLHAFIYGPSNERIELAEEKRMV